MRHNGCQGLCRLGPLLRHLILILLSLLPAFGMTAQAAQHRQALVIGNAAYRYANPLVNTLNDARDIANELRATGFQVSEIYDADLDHLIDAMDKFVTRLHEQGGVGVLYYSGHGVQVDGENYLVPIDARLKRKSRIKYEAYALNDALSRMGGRGADSINLVVLDACRDNPFASTRGMGGKGLARVEAPESTLILYAAKPGQTASDNPEGHNGLFTKYLRQAIRRPGMNVENAFSEIVKQVYQESGRAQYPWKEGVLLHPFAFVPKERQVQQSAPDPATLPDGLNPEMLYWESIKDSDNPSLYQAYLGRYPQGHFVELARIKIEVARNKLAPKPGPAPSAPSPVSVPPSSGTMAYDRSLVASITASSHLASQRDRRGKAYAYGPSNAMDGDPKTAWVEGSKGHGIGDWIKVQFSRPVRIQAIAINGEYKGKKNNRLKALSIGFSNTSSLPVRLADQPGKQMLRLNQPQITQWVIFRIQEVYRGTRFADTPIAEIDFE